MEKRPENQKKPFRSDSGKKPFGKSGEKKPFGEKKSFGKPGDKKPFGKPAGKKPFGKPAEPRPAGPFGRPASEKPEESTGLSMNARRVALDVLCDVHQNGAYASLSLDEKLRNAKLRPEDRRLVTSIVYGTLENELRIDYALDKLMDHPTHQPSQRDILRMSAYQILFLDRVPDSAAVNEVFYRCFCILKKKNNFINIFLRMFSHRMFFFSFRRRIFSTLSHIISIIETIIMFNSIFFSFIIVFCLF